MKRREFVKKAGTGATALSLQNILKGSELLSKKKKPNLVFVFTDQQSRDMVGCYGNQDIITPNLDRLAREGIRFNHCVSSQPVCTPFRGMMLSGQHPLCTGAYANDIPLLANNGKYFGHALKEAGYKTGYIGKWHLLGGNRDRPVPEGIMRYGFDDTFLTNNCHVDYRPGISFFWNENDEKEFFDVWEVYGQTNQALDFLDDCSSEEPFALFVSWHPPHDWGIDAESLLYKYDTMPELMSLYNPDKINLRPSVKDTPEIRHAYHGYYGMCSGVDKAFGMLLDKLEEKGLRDDTLIVYTSDHGDNLNSYDYFIAKDHPEDTSTRIPFIMSWPAKLPVNKVSDLLINPMDMMPTILGMMDIDIPESVQGQNLASAIRKGEDDKVDSVPLFFFAPSWKGVYTHDFTYGYGILRHFTHKSDGSVGFKEVPVRALYDRRKDPWQLNNLFDKREALPLRKEMEKLTKKWMERFEDPDVSHEELNKRYANADGSFPENTREPGFRGRPVDVLKS